jgi:hypothetical protein
VNTAQLYVEPIIVGFLVLLLFALPYAPEIVSILGQMQKLNLPNEVALGAVLIGLAYVVGMLADRLIDSGLEALEKHNRVRFACSKLTLGTLSDEGARRAAWCSKHRKEDLFPEDRRRWWVYTESEKIVDFLNYVRTRIRLLRALTFLLPGLFYAGMTGAARIRWKLDCTPPLWDSAWQPPVGCEEANSRIGIALPEPSDWYFLWAAPAAYALVALVAWGLAAADRIRKVAEAPSAKENSLRETMIPVPDGESFIWSRPIVSCRAGTWRPPRTNHDREMRVYAGERGWPAGSQARRALAGDVLAQPFVWLAAGLLLASIPSWARLFDAWALWVAAVLLAALLSLAAGWAWWRTTGTFMAYLDGAGRFLEEKAASSTGPVGSTESSQRSVK